MRPLTIWIACVLAGGSLAGCADVGTVDAHQQRVIEDADADAVLTAATGILQREFGRVKVDRLNRRIETAPVEFTTARDSGTARDLYRGRSTMRRTGHFSVGQSGGQTVARLRVDVDRRDMGPRTLMRPESHRLSDTPGQQTPIEADAATTDQQNTAWTRVRRDRALERQLLDELREQFARLSPEAERAAAGLPSATQPTSAGQTAEPKP